MPYTTSSPPILIGRKGYSAEHYDFAFSPVGALSPSELFDAAAKVERLIKAKQYEAAADYLATLDASDRDKILAQRVRGMVDEATYRRIVERSRGTAGGRAWSYLKGSLFGGGGGGPIPSGAPNYLLYGGLAVGGLLLVMLLTKDKSKKTQ